MRFKNSSISSTRIDSLNCIIRGEHNITTAAKSVDGSGIRLIIEYNRDHLSLSTPSIHGEDTITMVFFYYAGMQG